MWVSTTEAAIVYGVSSRAIQAACKRGSTRYLYRERDGVGGNGGTVYEIWVEPKATSVPERKPSMGDDHRVTVVQMALRRSGSLRRFVEELGDARVSEQSLRRWIRLYKGAYARGESVVEALRDGRGRPKGSTVMTEAMQEFVRSELLRRDIHPLMSSICERLRQVYPDAPSQRTVERWAAAWKQANRHLWDHATNPDRAKGQYKPAIGSASEAYRYPNAAWELDATPADVMTSDGMRWTIYGAIDVYSRRVFVSMEKSTSSYAVSRNLRGAILKMGLPELLIVDNGRDYTSNHIEDICLAMGIGKREVPPYSGEMKPHIERFFGTLTRDLFRTLRGFVGHNVAEAQALRSSKSFEKRREAIARWKEKQWSESGFARAILRRGEADMFVDIPISSDELREALEQWVEKYEHRRHSSLGMSPAERWSGHHTRRVASERSLDLMMGVSRVRTVTKEGIVITTDGIRNIYWETALVEWIGRRVRVIEPDDMHSVAVYDPENGKFICTASDPAVSDEAKRSIIKEARSAYNRLASKANKAVREAEKRGEEYDRIIAGVHSSENEEARSEERDEERQEMQDEERTKRAKGVVKYASLLERFVRKLGEGTIDDKDRALAAANPEIWEMAKKSVKSSA